MTSIHLRKELAEVRASYWFIPLWMTLGGIALAIAMSALDDFAGAFVSRIFGGVTVDDFEGARSILSAIANSMITVAGVTFSITIASVVYATSQYGPRLLTNFMEDRGNQVTLGTFIATYVYCMTLLLTLRIDRGFDEPQAPALGVMIAFLLALASVGVLIYFIHHVPASMHVSRVLANIGGELHDKVERLYPEMLGFGPPEDEDYEVKDDVPEGFFEEAVAVKSPGSGYLQYVDEERLLAIAVEEGLIFRLEYHPGDFVMEHTSLIYAWSEGEIPDELHDRIRSAFVWGRQRSADQDIRFLIDELVEVAARALSPGVNDPMTAKTCMDWYGSVLLKLSRRDLPSTYRYDETGQLRLITRPIAFRAILERGFGGMRPYVQADINSALHMTNVLGSIIIEVDQESRREDLLMLASELLDGARSALGEDPDFPQLEDRVRSLVYLTHNPAPSDRPPTMDAWLGGSG